MQSIYNIAQSIAESFGFTITRLDIQRYQMGRISGYVGFLYASKDDSPSMTFRIRQDGSFEIVEER